MKNPHSGGKPRSPLYQANNEGGYGNPPVSGQFKPGNKGGPGRKKGSTSLDNALRKLFRSKVTIKKDGELRKIAMTEAMAERARKEILSGSYKALELGLQLAAKFGPEEIKEEPPQFDFSDMTKEQRWAFRKLLMTIPGVDEAGFKQVQYEMEREEQERKDAARKRRQERRAQTKKDLEDPEHEG